jgi:hypothetical protein
MLKCPRTKKDCLKNECALWIELVVDKPGQGKQNQGRCSIAWIPVLLCELRETVAKLSGTPKNDG